MKTLIKAIIKMLDSAFTGLVLLILFLALAVFCQMAFANQGGYEKSEVDALNELVATGTITRGSKLTQKQALYEVWGLTQDDVARPVELIFADRKE